MRKKFKIYQNGELYKPTGKNMIVMNNQGIFFLVYMEDYYPYVRRLSDVIGYYDVKWEE
jgi:hypothetical protein